MGRRVPMRLHVRKLETNLRDGGVREANGLPWVPLAALKLLARFARCCFFALVACKKEFMLDG